MSNYDVSSYYGCPSEKNNLKKGGKKLYGCQLSFSGHRFQPFFICSEMSNARSERPEKKAIGSLRCWVESVLCQIDDACLAKSYQPIGCIICGGERAKQITRASCVMFTCVP